MREQRRWVETPCLHHRHQPSHSFFAAGAQRRDDFVIADAGGERVVRNLKFARIYAEAAQRAAGTQTA